MTSAGAPSIYQQSELLARLYTEQRGQGLFGLFNNTDTKEFAQAAAAAAAAAAAFHSPEKLRHMMTEVANHS